jgi:hypothetical protein
MEPPIDEDVEGGHRNAIDEQDGSGGIVISMTNKPRKTILDDAKENSEDYCNEEGMNDNPPGWE